METKAASGQNLNPLSSQSMCCVCGTSPSGSQKWLLPDRHRHPANLDDLNLRSWCTWCHLHHDQPHHKETRCHRKETTAAHAM
jgi:hypothetical protein